MASSRRILYCHCASCRTVPEETRQAVLRGLAESRLPFDATADLCELAARRDERLARWAERAAVQVVACWPRAVRWLFAAGGAELSDRAEVLNMKAQTAEEILHRLRAAEGGA